MRNKLHRNNRDGTFGDVTREAGLDLQLHPTGGGSGHGMAAADFDNDSWPDLYVGVWQAPNRMFLNDQEGGFRDIMDPVLADPGKTFGVAAADIDNDGDIDIFQAGGGRIGGQPTVPSPSFLFANQGDASFLNVSKEAGLSLLYDVPSTYLSENAVTGLVDVDNDGDLDLVVGAPVFRLFTNDGSGVFEEAAETGITTSGTFSVADHDGDGFQDLWVSGGVNTEFNLESPPTLYHNRGNDNHWLQVELVGIQSNRRGIGAKLLARAGEHRWVRELQAGTGFLQHALVVQFGLAQNARLDQLEIQWPSGVVDVLPDVPSDQRIRVFEGRSDFQPVQPTAWESDFPDTVSLGETIELRATVRPALYEADARITAVTVDLSGVGGPEALALTEKSEGEYELSTSITVGGENGPQPVIILIEQATSVGAHRVSLTREIRIRPTPGQDMVFFADGADVPVIDVFLGEADLLESDVVFEGDFALALASSQSSGSAPAGFQLRFPVEGSVSVDAFASLRFAVNMGEVKAPLPLADGSEIRPDFVAVIEADEFSAVSLLEGFVDPALAGWQQVDIPLRDFDLNGDILGVGLFGNFQGRIIFDDIRLVHARPTAVTEEHTAIVPGSSSLEQNFPNPFNSNTTIRFSLSEFGNIDLVVYNLTGQKVATLAHGRRSAGEYTLRWDGRDNAGLALASGVYLYRLQTGFRVETRRLLLLR